VSYLIFFLRKNLNLKIIHIFNKILRKAINITKIRKKSRLINNINVFWRKTAIKKNLLIKKLRIIKDFNKELVKINNPKILLANKPTKLAENLVNKGTFNTYSSIINKWW
jgi:hypothetical protein